MAAIENLQIAKGRENKEITVKVATDFLNSKAIYIPPWQREVTWKEDRRMVFVQSVMDGDPTPQILLRRMADLNYGLEDGRQRLSALRDYRDNLYAAKDGRKFNQLSEAEQEKFMGYRIPMQTYWGYSDAEAIQFFLKYQEGVALSVGEKYHAVNEMSPLVKMTKEMLMTAGKGFHDRAEKVWGRRCDEMNRKGDNITDKNRKWLCDACAIIAGLVWGPHRITKKWKEISTEDAGNSMLTMPLGVGVETNEDVKKRVAEKLDIILSIYEEAQRINPISITKCKKQFDPGFATGHIIHSMSVLPADQYPALQERWVSFLVQERKDDKKGRKPLLQREEIVGNGAWCTDRWRLGHGRVFAEVSETSPAASNDDEEDEEEDEDSE
jgi:hypothetical protein